ncbi:NAD(P)H-hydrate dehydratase [Candidatus Peregrinibacteria bacterium]|nr:NAD(P)H-hydrate dehydratase [Candidatus Peregrinibacteria bacterium]
MEILPVLRRSDVKKFFPSRIPESHKGMNGRVLIIGGSADYYGAPILSAMGALNSGCDLVYLYVPECNFDVTRNAMPDFIVKKYSEDYFNKKAAHEIANFAKTCHVALIGPGIGENESVIEGVIEFLRRVHIPTVLDSHAIYALKKIKEFPFEQPIIITPHLNEFEQLIDKELDKSGATELERKKLLYLQMLSKELYINIVLKGKTDYISSDRGEIVKNTTGNAGMTVGGTGDVLAGIIASLISQGASPINAAKAAVFVNGIAGENLFKKKHYCYTASDLANELPYVIKNILD